VLDVGPATGYSTAVLARLAASVVAVECDAGLAALARETLADQAVSNVVIQVGPLEKGAPGDGPFQVILVNGRLARRPDALLSQLAPDGRLVAVIGGGIAAKAVFFRKTGAMVESVNAFDANCPSLPGFEAEDIFTF
jgi:protein-L-isoaspartate(D-aspartate) O-methyltransferase